MRVDCRILIDTYVMHCKMLNHKSCKVAGCGLRFLGMTCREGCYIQDVTPKVVAIAVRIVMAMWMIFCQISCLFIVVCFCVVRH